MTERVRAILITPNNTMLFIKRIRPGIAPYWVTVGGGVEDTDASRHAALLREIGEEIAGTAQILRQLHEMENDKGEKELFYLALVERWNFADRTGPEFSRTDRGEYLLEEVPLSTQALDQVNLMPPEFAAVLRQAVEHGDLLTTP
ncbi:NUDIX domain-containing protein [Streptacidiphilus sp. MAP5-3]|uniref:NUDIX hydrolase n=1 Tax=unclassified Streptacidiphilus TaxID=2643834 RepID=UPI003517E534